MPSLYARLNIVRRLPRPWRDAALVAVLPASGVEERDAIVGEMLQAARHPRSRNLYGTILRNWHILGPHARAATLAALGEDLSTVFERLRTSNLPADRRAAALIAVACLSGYFGTELGEAGEQGVSVSGRKIPLQCGVVDLDDPELRDELDAALADSAARFNDERLDGVMDAIARVAHAPGPRLRNWLDDEEQAGHLLVRSAAKRLGEGIVVRHAVAWLGIRALRPVGVGAIGRPHTLEEIGAILNGCHLLRARGRQGALRRVTKPLAALSTPVQRDGLLPRQRRSEIALIETLPFKHEQRIVQFGARFEDADPGVRVRALEAIARERASQQTDELLLDFAFDGDPRIAYRAASILSRAETESRREALIPSWRKLARSPHASVRRLAEGVLDRLDPWRASSADSGSIAARRRLAQNGQLFLAELEKYAAGSDAAMQLRAFMLADRLNVLDRIEAILIRSTMSEDARVASKAVLLLARLPGEGTLRVLHEALRAADARVRANAVEAIGSIEPDDGSLDAMLEDASARVRANVVRHFLQRAPRDARAEHALSAMLTDARPAHRLAGVWVTQRLAKTGMASRIAELASNDPDERVHDMARGCARRLLAAMRVEWSRPRTTGITIAAPSQSFARAG